MKINKTNTDSADQFDNIKLITKTVVGGLIILASAAVVLKISKVMIKDLREMGL